MTTISSLASAAALSGTEPLPVDQSGATVKATVNQVKTYVNSSPAITGGSINSTPIGATTPSTGAFTTLSVSNGTLNVTIGPNTVGQSAAGGDLYLQSQTGRHVYTQVGGTSVTDISSSGLAVTGNISASGRALVGTTTDDGVNALQVNGTAKASTLIAQQTGGTAANDVASTVYKTGGSGSVISRLQTSALASSVFDLETNDGSGNAYRYGSTYYDSIISSSYNGTNPWGSLRFATGNVVRMAIIGGTGATAGSVLMTSGLSVTGNISATGTITPQQATTAGAPAYVKGAIYFDTTLNKLRVGGATAWETITSI